jgi:hypothetical protein
MTATAAPTRKAPLTVARHGNFGVVAEIGGRYTVARLDDGDTVGRYDTFAAAWDDVFAYVDGKLPLPAPRAERLATLTGVPEADLRISLAHFRRQSGLDARRAELDILDTLAIR